MIPKNCTFKIYEYFMDITRLTGKNCQNYDSKETKKTLLKYSKSPYIKDNTKRIGYPLTNKDPTCFLDFFFTNNLIKKYFDYNLVDMDDEQALKEKFKDKMPEIEVDLTNNKQNKIKINVFYNETLSKERKILESNSKPYSNNIILLFIDSVSRANALRQLKKTLKFFEKFISYKGGKNENYPSENFHSFQFFKYISFKGYTTVNYPLLFYGQKKDNKNKALITKFFKENGYITSLVHDTCSRDNTRSYHNFTLEEIYDHEFLICDPNNDNFSLYSKRCLYGKQNIEYLLEYTEQFWNKYVTNRKLSVIITNHGHEGTLTLIKYIDEIIYNFLNTLFNNNLLKDSSIFLFSDHGSGMPSIYYLYDFFKIEMHLPMLFIIINDRKNISYSKQYKHIKENQQILITAFDIYNTIGHLIYGEKYYFIENKTILKDTFKSKYGISLFNKINPKARVLKKYDQISSINKNICY